MRLQTADQRHQAIPRGRANAATRQRSRPGRTGPRHLFPSVRLVNHNDGRAKHVFLRDQRRRRRA